MVNGSKTYQIQMEKIFKKSAEMPEKTCQESNKYSTGRYTQYHMYNILSNNDFISFTVTKVTSSKVFSKEHSINSQNAQSQKHSAKISI